VHKLPLLVSAVTTERKKAARCELLWQRGKRRSSDADADSRGLCNRAHSVIANVYGGHNQFDSDRPLKTMSMSTKHNFGVYVSRVSDSTILFQVTNIKRSKLTNVTLPPTRQAKRMGRSVSSAGMRENAGNEVKTHVANGVNAIERESACLP